MGNHRMKYLALYSLGISLMAPSIRAQAKLDFVKDIQPILQQTCIKCHGAEKQKGKLRLDAGELAMKGGKGGPAIVAGDASKSDLYRRVTLPKTDDDFMPSEGEPLTAKQLEMLRDWINQGASWPASATPIASKDGASGAPLEIKLPEYKPSAAETKAIEKLLQAGIDVRPIAMNTQWREANLRLLGTNVLDSSIAPLKDVLGLVDLNLAQTKVTDNGLAAISGLSNLTRLHLELTGVTDAGLTHIKNLSNLTYLNLYGTPVSDAGLAHLTGLKKLKNLYVWQTKITEAGIAQIKKTIPGLEVVAGLELKPIEKPPEKKEDKKEEKKEENKEEKKKD